MVLPHNARVEAVAMATGGRGGRPKTLRGFKIRDPFPKPVRKFDDSDLTNMTFPESEKAPPPDRAVALPRTVPTHLLMISVLEQLCMMYEKDEAKARELFKLLCEHLVTMRVVSPLTSLDEMSGMRAQYRHHVHRMILTASATIHKHQSVPALPAPVKSLAELSSGLSPLLNGPSSELPFVRFDDVVSSQTSRYRQEFVELGQLGRGGFGSVFMARNKLDGRKYAVKKIKFRHASPHVLLKVLREVKALANLQHPNIIGYNGTWLEYEQSHFNSFPALSKLWMAEDSSSSHFSRSAVTGDDSDIVFAEDDFHEVVDFQVNSYGFGPQDEISFGGSDLTSGSESPAALVSKSGQNCVKTVRVETASKYTHSEMSLTTLKTSRSASELTFDALKKDSSKDISVHKEVSPCDNTANLSVSEVSKKTILKRRSMEQTRNTNQEEEPVFTRNKNVIWRRSISCDLVASGEKVLHGNNNKDLVDYSDENFLIEMNVTLYIQMELCSHTLQEWLMKRNTCTARGDNSSPDSAIDVSENMRIFHQLVRGVQYIHSQGVLHRDLKPRNIFMNASDLHVKIGDFGLARENVSEDLPETVLSPPAHLKAQKFWEDNTHGVGTSTYAAPEQLIGTTYDNKCDIYSLGVILYEMFEQFSTEMERHEKLKVLRDRSLPEEFVQRWPEQAKTIISLTSSDPALRPSAKELLDSELFLSKSQVIRDLRKTVKAQESEIDRLRCLLKDRDEEISVLKQKTYL